ncbi:hypothetical protein IAT38_001734 [Cryptococcus sp. DSM 104549]
MNSLLPALLLASTVVRGAAVQPRAEAEARGWFDSYSTSSSDLSSTYLKQAQSGVSGLASGWEASGCYSDDTSSRTLNKVYTWSLWMDYSTCTSFCDSQGYSYAGVEYGIQCFCANSISSDASIQPYSSCGQWCGGNWWQDCGGSSLINVFHKTSTSGKKATSTLTAQAFPSTSTTAASTAKTSSTSTSSSATSTSTAKTSTSSSVSSTSTSVSSSSSSSSSSAAKSSTSSSAASSSSSSAAASTSVAASTSASSSASSSAAASTSKAAVVTIPDVVASVTSVLSSAQAAVTSAASSAVAAVNVTSAVADATSVASAAKGAVTEAVANATSSVVSAIQSVATEAAANATSVLSAVESAATSVVANATSVVGAIESVATEAVANATSSVVSAVESAATAATEAVANATTAVSAIASVATEAAANVTSAAVEVATSVASAIESVVTDVANATSVVSAAESAITEAVANATSAIGDAVTSVASAAESEVTAIVSSVEEVATSVISSVEEAATSVVSSAVAAASSAVASLPSGWTTSSICIAEGTSGRALASASYASSEMTQATCASYCGDKGYTLAGIEYASECWCGDILSNGASLLSTSTACTMSCSGDSTSICGGGNALTLIVSDKAVATLNAALTGRLVTLPTGWSAAATTCVSEGTSGRALASASTASDDMTIETCLNFCGNKGFQYAGIEYGRECYCGNSLVNGASLTLPSTGCSVACAGDDTTVCGGGNALSLYVNPSLALDLTHINGYAYQGCMMEVSGRAFTNTSAYGSDMTIEKCTTVCADAGLPLAGIEYGSECYCGSTFANGASLDLLSTQCTMNCPGDETETCGGPNALSVYLSLGTLLSSLV